MFEELHCPVKETGLHKKLDLAIHLNCMNIILHPYEPKRTGRAANTVDTDQTAP